MTRRLKAWLYRCSFTLSFPPGIATRKTLRELLQHARRVERAEIAEAVELGSPADARSLTAQLIDAWKIIDDLQIENAALRGMLLAAEDAAIARTAVAAGEVA